MLLRKTACMLSLLCVLLSAAYAFAEDTNVVRLPNGVEITMTLTSQLQPPQKVWAKKICVHTGTNMDTEPLDRFFAGRNANVTSFTHYASSPENGYGIRENTAESAAAYHSMSFSAGLLDYQKNDACWVLLSHEADSLAQTPTGVSFSDDICALWEYLGIEVSPEARKGFGVHRRQPSRKDGVRRLHVAVAGVHADDDKVIVDSHKPSIGPRDLRGGNGQ